MRPYGKTEIGCMAQAAFDRQVSGNGLRNAKKIIAEVKRLILAEEKRRKKLEGK